MKTSITKDQKNKIPLWTIPIWIIIWQIGSMLIGKDILLASPMSVLKSFSSLIFDKVFQMAIGFSLGRIFIGFLLASILGIIFAYSNKIIRDIISLPIEIMRAAPIASFVVLVLIWVPSKNLSIIISFIMTFPIVYSNVRMGIEQMDRKIIEMLDIFKVSPMKRAIYYGVPAIIPFLKTGFLMAVGMCLKAGVAAELIGVPSGSIGESLYMAKVYLRTPEVFVWTITVIILSVLISKVLGLILDVILYKLEDK